MFKRNVKSLDTNRKIQMNYILYGSKTSPFVRRIRMILETLPYEFKELDIFGADKELIKTINPINQIPVLLLPFLSMLSRLYVDSLIIILRVL